VTATPYIVQTGMGVDIHGTDDTTAACRAVEAAIRHNSLVFLGQIGLESRRQIHVDVTIACPHPERLDADTVSAVLPVGVVSVRAEKGGMLAETGTRSDPMLIAIAAVLVSVETAAP
jgi:uncharacterized protein (TIGR02058 family)